MKPRRILLTGGLIVWFAAIAVRLVALQVIEHDDYRERAERQQERIVELDPPRATIYDAVGRELAVSVEVESVYAVPRRIDDAAATARQLASVLPVDADALAEALDSDKGFWWVYRKLDPPLAEAVRALDLEGVHFLPESKRYYPLRHLAAQLLGYVGTDNSGLAGLESRYDDVVASEPGRRTVVQDARFVKVVYPGRETAPAQPGRSLHLTLDAAIQNVVERELAAAVRRFGARSASAVLLAPDTGKVLAMASSPAFDPNRFADYPPPRWRNTPVTDAYEPGSTFKMVTVTAALEAGAVEPWTTVDCGMGSITLERARIHDHRPFGLLSVRDVVARSSNVGAVKVGLAAGTAHLYRTIGSFGFGDRTGVDLPGENPGLLRPLEKWSPLTPAYVAFGQGISVTALQLARAFAAVANGGTLLRPYVVAAVGDDARPPAEGRLVEVAPSTLRQVESMLEAVVVEGTGTAAAIPGYRVAGKTGTAQKALDGRGYAEGRHVASFAGYAPVGRPAVVGVVVIDEPQPIHDGGKVAAPVFAEIVRRVLLHLGVPPDPREVPAFAETTGALAAVSSPTPPARPAAAATPPPGTVPDLVGLAARRAVAQAARVGLAARLRGHGFVVEQSPPPGTPLEAAAGSLDLRLSPVGERELG